MACALVWVPSSLCLGYRSMLCPPSQARRSAIILPRPLLFLLVPLPQLFLFLFLVSCIHSSIQIGLSLTLLSTTELSTPHKSQSKYTSMADAAHKLDLRVGGKYRLSKKIGSGSFGTFWLLLALLRSDLPYTAQVTSTSEST